MDLVKAIVILLVVAIAVMLIAAIVAEQPWVYASQTAAGYLNAEAVGTSGSASTSSTPWAIAVAAIDRGIGINYGNVSLGGAGILAGSATFLIGFSIAWFVFRIAQRVLKG